MTTMELIDRGIGHNCLSDAYELGRADAIAEIEKRDNRSFLTTDQIHDLCTEAMIKGRADMKMDFIGMLEREFAIQNNPNSKFVETIVLKRDFIEQLKEEKNE